MTHGERNNEDTKMLKITYYADVASMGDTSPEGCGLYRSWAEKEIKAAYPNHNITVLDKSSFEKCSTNDEKIHEEIAVFCSELWDRCPLGAIK